MAKKLTNEEFLKDVNEKLGDKIDFSKAEYVNDSTKILCKCKVCGNEWFATPNNIKHGRGCPRCNHKSTKYTLEEWLSIAEAVNNGRYDLSLIKEYNSRNDKLPFICPKHGVFYMRAKDFLDGHGCKKCRDENNRQTSKPYEKMVEDARKVHGDKYVYDKETYSNARTKMRLICPTHGEFWQTPHKHINGKQGCPKCGGSERLTQDEYIERVKTIHGDKYDYSKTMYISMRDNILIVCPRHGEFWQNAKRHANGHGCPLCAEEKKGEAQRYSTEKFIELAKRVHGDKYDYSKVEYVNMYTPVEIICLIHGVFKQTPLKHIHGKQGCPKCNSSHLETDIRNLLDENGIEYIEHCNKRVLSWLDLQHLDFYLPKENIAIECQGEQHFRAVPNFGGEEGFVANVKRDEIKRELCKKHGVRLIYYATCDEAVEDGNILFKDKVKLLNEGIYSNKNTIS